MHIGLAIASPIRLGCYKIVEGRTLPQIGGVGGFLQTCHPPAVCAWPAAQTTQRMVTVLNRCTVRVIGGIAFAATQEGRYGAPELREACEQTMERLGGIVPSVYVADFRRTTWRLRTLHLDALFDGVDPAIQVPAAMVVPEASYSMFRAHAWNVAQGGILRKVFTDYPSAVRWAQARESLSRPAKIVP